MEINNNCKTVVFDFFGVICSEVAPFWLEKYFSQEDSASLMERYMRPADIGAISESALLDTLASLIDSTPESVREEWFSYVKIDKEMVSLINSIKSRFKIVLASNAASDFLHQILRENDLEKLFDEIIVSSEVGVAKPDPLFFEKTLEILKENPESLLFFDDNPVNVKAAQKLGIKSYLFKSIKDADFLKKQKPTHMPQKKH